MACQLYDFLPLPDYAIAECDSKGALHVKDALFVAAERINRVFDPNRRPQQRVDLVAYMATGEVIRFHPGMRNPIAWQREVASTASTMLPQSALGKRCTACPLSFCMAAGPLPSKCGR